MVCIVLLSVITKRKPPLFAAMLIAGVYMGNVLDILLVIQLLKNMDNFFHGDDVGFSNELYAYVRKAHSP